MAESSRGIGTGRTDAEIAAFTVGAPTRIDGPIDLRPWTPAWAEAYAHEERRIRAVLGGVVRSLHHVGSTSVPGLTAKPVVDAVMGVPDSADEHAYVAPLEEVGYRLRIREPDWYEHRLLKGPDTDVNLHVFTEGHPEIARMILFRDHLRAHDGDLELYAATKRELAARRWTHVQHYADAKTAVVDEILARAHRAAGIEDHRRRG